MEKTTLRVKDGTLDELDDEAEEQGMTRSQYLRWIIERRDRIRETTTDDGRYAELERRISEIEQRLDEAEK